MACLVFAIKGIKQSNYQSDVGSKLGLSFFFTFLVVGLKNPCHPLNKSDAKLELKFQLSHMYFPTLPAVLFSLQVLIWLHVILILISDKPFSDHLLYLVMWLQ